MERLISEITQNKSNYWVYQNGRPKLGLDEIDDDNFIKKNINKFIIFNTINDKLFDNLIQTYINRTISVIILVNKQVYNMPNLSNNLHLIDIGISNMPVTENFLNKNDEINSLKRLFDDLYYIVSPKKDILNIKNQIVKNSPKHVMYLIMKESLFSNKENYTYISSKNNVVDLKNELLFEKACDILIKDIFKNVVPNVFNLNKNQNNEINKQILLNKWREKVLYIDDYLNIDEYIEKYNVYHLKDLIFLKNTDKSTILSSDKKKNNILINPISIWKNNGCNNKTIAFYDWICNNINLIKEKYEIDNLNLTYKLEDIYYNKLDVLDYKLPKFYNDLKNKLNANQKNLIKYFENYNINKKSDTYNINYLYQSDFEEGTLRLKKSGIYILQEDIIFNPNNKNNHMPTKEQIINGTYPVGKGGFYQLGFFAAITIECDNIILDLNGKELKQSLSHHLLQRFYANIELGSAPFIPKQGPASLSNSQNYIHPNNILIMNGNLGLSSHHGIHGNNMKNIVLHNLKIYDFEVAGIALNGGVNSILNDINIEKASQDIKVVSRFSQSIFIKPFLERLKKEHPHAYLTINNRNKSIEKIIYELNQVIDDTYTSIITKNRIPNNVFANPSKLYDGHVYGIVLNVNGVIVGNFLKERTEKTFGNEDIVLNNIKINNIISDPVEIRALCNHHEDPLEEAYGGKRQVGPVGDVLDIDFITKNNKYDENILSNAQIILAKYVKYGTLNIEKYIVNWVEKNSNLNEVLKEQKCHHIIDGDSMGHFMKGNIGLFISGGKNINIHTLKIDNIDNKMNFTNEDLKYKNFKKKKYTSNGVLITGSSNINIINDKITNINSKTNNSNTILQL